jgi:uncharacterized protein YndB with AHSA1/START domain
VSTVVRAVEVPVDPATAFEVFTEEIGEWYRSGPYSWNDPKRAVGIRFDRERLVEVWNAETGEGYEMGRVLVWEPGVRLAFEFRSMLLPPEPTEVEVRFEPVAGGTRVTLEHRGLDRLPADEAERLRRYAWIPFMGWFRDYVAVR